MSESETVTSNGGGTENGLGLGRRKCLWDGNLDSTQFLDAIYRHIDKFYLLPPAS